MRESMVYLIEELPIYSRTQGCMQGCTLRHIAYIETYNVSDIYQSNTSIALVPSGYCTFYRVAGRPRANKLIVP